MTVRAHLDQGLTISLTGNPAVSQGSHHLWVRSVLMRFVKQLCNHDANRPTSSK